jgi:hypothetical protein
MIDCNVRVLPVVGANFGADPKDPNSVGGHPVPATPDNFAVPHDDGSERPALASFHLFEKKQEALIKDAGFLLQIAVRERWHAELGNLLPMFHIERAVEPGVSALPHG